MQDIATAIQPYMPVIVPAVTFGLGWLAKHGQVFIQKVHQFRAVIDKVDDMMKSTTATDTDINSVIAAAQQL